MNQPISSRILNVVEMARRLDVDAPAYAQHQALLDLRQAVLQLDEAQMQMVNVILAETSTLPPVTAIAYDYVVGADGLYIRAQDSRLFACIPIADADVRGFQPVETVVEWKLPRIPVGHLLAILESARRHFPNEAMYQLIWGPGNQQESQWRITMPPAQATPTAIKFTENPDASMDIHSHGALPAFFSSTDDEDEQGFRAYVVIGKVQSEAPEILCRVGVYGHHYIIPAAELFENLGPFREVLTLSLDGPDTVDTSAEPEFEGEHRITQSEREGRLVVARFAGG